MSFLYLKKNINIQNKTFYFNYMSQKLLMNLPKFKLVDYELIDIESLFKENKKTQKNIIEQSKKEIIKKKFQYLINKCEEYKKFIVDLWKFDLMEKRIKEYKSIISKETFSEEQIIIFDYGDKLNKIFEIFIKGEKINSENIEEYKSLKTMNNDEFINQMIYELNNYSKNNTMLMKTIKVISFFLFYETFDLNDENPITNLKREILISHLHHQKEQFDNSFSCLFLLNNNYIPYEKINLTFEISNNNKKNEYKLNKEYIRNLLTHKCVLPSLYSIIKSYTIGNTISENELKNSIIEDIDKNKIYFIPIPENTIAGLTIYNGNIFLKLRYIHFLNKEKPIINEAPQQLNSLFSTLKHEQSQRNIKKKILKNQPFLNTIDIINENKIIYNSEKEEDIINTLKNEKNENFKIIEVENEHNLLKKKRKRKNISNIIKQNIKELFEEKKNINRKIYLISKLIEKEERSNLLNNLLFGNKKDYNKFTYHSSVYMLDVSNYPDKFYEISYNYNKLKKIDLKLEKKGNINILPSKTVYTKLVRYKKINKGLPCSRNVGNDYEINNSLI